MLVLGVFEYRVDFASKEILDISAFLLLPQLNKILSGDQTHL